MHNQLLWTLVICAIFSQSLIVHSASITELESIQNVKRLELNRNQRELEEVKPPQHKQWQIGLIPDRLWPSCCLNKNIHHIAHHPDSVPCIVGIIGGLLCSATTFLSIGLDPTGCLGVDSTAPLRWGIAGASQAVEYSGIWFCGWYITKRCCAYNDLDTSDPVVGER